MIMTVERRVGDDKVDPDLGFGRHVQRSDFLHAQNGMVIQQTCNIGKA